MEVDNLRDYWCMGLQKLYTSTIYIQLQPSKQVDLEL